MDGLLNWIVSSVGGGEGCFYSIEQKESFRLVSESSAFDLSPSAPHPHSATMTNYSLGYNDKLLSHERIFHHYTVEI